MHAEPKQEPPGGAATCQGPLPAKVLEGFRLFNARAFFEQHEALEEAWLAEPEPVRDLYRGILQIGVGFYHLERQNFRGARNLLTYGMDRLAPLRAGLPGRGRARSAGGGAAVSGRTGTAGSGSHWRVRHGADSIGARGRKRPGCVRAGRVADFGCVS